MNNKSTLKPEQSELLYSQSPRTEFVYCAHHCINWDYMYLIFKYVFNRKFIPIIPFLVFPPIMLIGLTQNEILGHDLRMLSKCDRLWIFGDYEDGGVAVERHWWHNNKNTLIIYIKLEEVCENITN